jgi:hypothetical protein
MMQERRSLIGSLLWPDCAKRNRPITKAPTKTTIHNPKKSSIVEKGPTGALAHAAHI